MTKWANNKFDDVMRNELIMHSMQSISTTHKGLQKDYELCLQNFSQISNFKKQALKGISSIGYWTLLNLVESQIKYITLAHNIWLDQLQTPMKRKSAHPTSTKIFDKICFSIFRKEYLHQSVLYRILKLQKLALNQAKYDLWKALFKKQMQWMSDNQIDHIEMPKGLDKQLEDAEIHPLGKAAKIEKFPTKMLGVSENIRQINADSMHKALVIRNMRYHDNPNHILNISSKLSLESLFNKLKQMEIKKITIEGDQPFIENLAKKFGFQIHKIIFEYRPSELQKMTKSSKLKEINKIENQIVREAASQSSQIPVFFTQFVNEEFDNYRIRCHEYLIKMWNQKHDDKFSTIDMNLDCFDSLESLVLSVMKNNMESMAG